jgi:hypothetical protein
LAALEELGTNEHTANDQNRRNTNADQGSRCTMDTVSTLTVSTLTISALTISALTISALILSEG